MKYSLKNEYKELLKEFRVSIETDEGYYDYEFDESNSNIDFKSLGFIDTLDKEKKELNTEFKKEIFKTQDYTSYANPTKSSPTGNKSFTLDANTGSLLQYVILKAIKNIVIYEKEVYGKLCDEYDISTKHMQDSQDDVLKSMLEAILDFLDEKYKEENGNLYIKTLEDAIKAINKKANQENYNSEKILGIVGSPDRADTLLRALTVTGKLNKIKTALLKYFKRDFTDKDRDKTASIQHTIIANEYMANGPDALSLFYRGKSYYEKNKSLPDQKNIRIRSDVNSIKDVENILNQANSVEIFKTINLKSAANRKGKGEFLCHMLFNTSNACLPIEPDVVIPNVGSFSVKSMASDSARTGENIDDDIKSSMEDLFRMLNPDYKYNSQITKNQLEDFVKNVNEIDKNNIKDAYNKLKIEIITEHDAEGLILHDQSGALSVVLKEEIDPNNVYLSEFKNNRWTFTYSTAQKNISYENVLRDIDKKIPAENSSYAPQGKVLKEIYSHLFKKKLISEGGLAGHMMHPYEALDMTPRQIIDRIKEYSTSQKIIEKVDGQNLFFTVEQDGTLMFARNKEDMTHNDLVEKFTNHPAEVPFITGGNAIKKGVDQWLSSAGAFGQQEILDIFHPDGEARSFINFEIMHKDHPNQLEYGENFIVLHSIIDFVDGREAVYSSNSSQRLDKLINLIKQGVESLGYTLASNRTVDLNKLTNVQVSHYANRIKEVASQLDITEDEFLGDGVEKQIKKQLDSEGINISDEAIKMLYDFALYGEDKSGNNIKSKDFTSLMQPEDVKKLRSINLTSANKAAAKVRRILSPFKEIFVDLGIDLLDSVPSSYMNSETDLANINSLRDKLETAIDDLSFYMDNTPESDWDSVVNRLKPHYDKVIEVGIENTVSTSVEGGVYDYQGDLLKVTGGFAPLNQVLGAAYRDKKGIFPTFKQKFMKQESNRKSLKSVFNLVY